MHINYLLHVIAYSLILGCDTEMSPVDELKAGFGLLVTSYSGKPEVCSKLLEVCLGDRHF